MTICLAPGSIGVRADQRQTIELAHRYGFESVEAFPHFLAGLSDQQMQTLQTDLKAKGLVFGHAGLPVNFRGDDRRFNQDLQALPQFARGLQRAGVTRVTTWLSPAHNHLTYLQNFRLHAQRLRKIAKVLKDHGQQFGLEYVGTPTARRGRFHFIHSMIETRELIEEIGTGNVGFVLDSWHWWTAGETEANLRTLNGGQVVSVDLNDAPAGIPIEQQQDGRRELPCATGVIPLKQFMRALMAMGYDGPMRAEPFNQALNRLSNEEACAATIKAMRQAVALG